MHSPASRRRLVGVFVLVVGFGGLSLFAIAMLRAGKRPWSSFGTRLDRVPVSNVLWVCMGMSLLACVTIVLLQPLKRTRAGRYFIAFVASVVASVFMLEVWRGTPAHWDRDDWSLLFSNCLIGMLAVFIHSGVKSRSGRDTQEPARDG